jgi:hypothetical protein
MSVMLTLPKAHCYIIINAHLYINVEVGVLSLMGDWVIVASYVLQRYWTPYISYVCASLPGIRYSF